MTSPVKMIIDTDPGVDDDDGQGRRGEGLRSCSACKESEGSNRGCDFVHAADGFWEVL